MLGENLDTDRIDASYSEGVLRLRIPVAEKAKPRKITVSRTSAITKDTTEIINSDNGAPAKEPVSA